MQPLLIILLLLSILTNVLLILLLLRSGQQNTAEDQTDEIARIVRDEVEAETEVLADQLRVMQGEVTRTTSASARDMGTLLAESLRSNISSRQRYRASELYSKNKHFMAE